MTQKPEASLTRALTTVSLVRALAHAGSTPAVRQLVLAASDAGGVLRPELGRLLKQLGDRAVAGLIEARRNPSPETRTWASNLLDGMARRTPGDAVQTKDDQALSDILRAYANIKEPRCPPRGPLVRELRPRTGPKRRPRRNARVRSGRAVENCRGLCRTERRARARGHRGGRPGEEALRCVRPIPGFTMCTRCSTRA